MIFKRKPQNSKKQDKATCIHRRFAWLPTSVTDNRSGGNDGEVCVVWLEHYWYFSEMYKSLCLNNRTTGLFFRVTKDPIKQVYEPDLDAVLGKDNKDVTECVVGNISVGKFPNYCNIVVPARKSVEMQSTNLSHAGLVMLLELLRHFYMINNSPTTQSGIMWLRSALMGDRTDVPTAVIFNNFISGNTQTVDLLISTLHYLSDLRFDNNYDPKVRFKECLQKALVNNNQTYSTTLESVYLLVFTNILNELGRRFVVTNKYREWAVLEIGVVVRGCIQSAATIYGHPSIPLDAWILDKQD